jgi:hypothetical protein
VRAKRRASATDTDTDTDTDTGTDTSYDAWLSEIDVLESGPC